MTFFTLRIVREFIAAVFFSPIHISPSFPLFLSRQMFDWVISQTVCEHGADEWASRNGLVNSTYDIGPSALYWSTRTCLIAWVDRLSFSCPPEDLWKHLRKLNTK